MKGAYARLQDCKVARFCLLRLNCCFTPTKQGVYPEQTNHRITKEEKSGKIVANQGIWMETAE